MKHLYIMAALVIALMMCGDVVWAAAPTGGAISITQDTNIAYTISIDTAPANIDTLYRCTLSGSDTTFVAISDTTAESVEVTGISPGTAITTFLLVRGEDGKTAISDKETFTMYGPETEYIPATKNDRDAMTRTLFLIEKVIRAVSWRPSTVLETFTLDGAAATDSSGHYTPWENNSLVAVATQAGDSVATMLYVHYGYRVMTQTGATKGFAAAVDSLNITGPGTFTKTLTANIALPTMYFTFGSYAGNGHDAEIELFLTRERY